MFAPNGRSESDAWRLKCLEAMPHEPFNSGREERTRRGVPRVVRRQSEPGEWPRFVAGIAVALVYLTYRAVLWLEAKDYGTFLDFMQSQG